MIKFGFNTIAMLTYGLGVRMPWPSRLRIRRRPAVTFEDKPLGIAIEEKTAPVLFEEEEVELQDKDTEFKDR